MLRDKILHKIKNADAKVVVIGGGYVGLPLALDVARAGFECTVYDVDENKIRNLEQGKSYISDVDSCLLAQAISIGLLRATIDPNVIVDADVVVVCVPTPLNKTRDPDLRFVIEASKTISQFQHEGLLVIIESTTYPGTTREIVLPILTEKGFDVGENLFLSFSPERIDPGNTKYSFYNTFKVVGGITDVCKHLASSFYGSVIGNDLVFCVSSVEAAEMTKIYENTFRQVNIALANEFSMISRKLGINIWEVIDAASTKPFGFMPFYPGPGLGGHCIPIDPMYLSWRMRSLNSVAQMIELSDRINSGMPREVVLITQQALNNKEKSLKNSKILISGVSYKRDVEDTRESPAFEIVDLFLKHGSDVYYYDPLVSEFSLKKDKKVSTLDDVHVFDAVVIVTDHTSIDYPAIYERAQLVIDTRNALSMFEEKDNVIRL